MSTLEECRKSKTTVASTKAESSSPISLLSNESSSGKVVLGRHSSLLEIQRSELVIMDRLCSGGFSTVYRGEWRYTGIAVKILRCKVGDKAYASLQTELAVLSQLRHPRILTLMGVCRDLNMMDGTVALIMELMERGSLYSILHENSSSSYAPSNTIERLRLALDIADGMRFLHKSGVVHRDLKSANVLVGSDGRAKIADFGLSSYHQQAQTLVTNVISTPAYSSPEVIRGEGAITSSADVFSFGVILWELLTGLSPWEGKTTVQIIFMSMQGTNLSLSRQVRSDYPDVAHMMEKCFIGAASRPRFSELYIEISILLTEAIEGKIGTPPREEIPEQTKHALSAKVLRRLSGTSLEREISGMNIGDDRRRTASNAPEKERSSATQSSPKRERRRHTESTPAASREVARAPAPVRSASMPPLAPAQPISIATSNASHIPSHPEAIRSAMRTIPENMEWDSIESVRDNTGQRLSEFI
jgi:serine/threonine protein kinase